MTFKEIRQTVMALPVKDRLKLAIELLDSISKDHPGPCADDPQFLDELDRRIDDPATNVSWETVQAEMRAELNR